MSTRLFLLKLVAMLAALIAGGCIAPIHRPSDDVEPKPPIDDVGQLEPSTIAVSMSSDDFANVVRWFGESNSITLHEPLKVSHDKVSLDFPANTHAHYTTNDAEVVITFDKPYPVVKAGLAKLIGGVSLRSVKINADGSGEAGTILGNFGFRWNEEVAGVADLPEVYLYVTSGCPACEVAKRELEKATDLPFKVIVKDTAPSWVTMYPTLHWQVSGDDWRYRVGWDGVPRFVEIWKKSRAAHLANLTNLTTPAAARPGSFTREKAQTTAGNRHK
jgi:hypothetical protein